MKRGLLGERSRSAAVIVLASLAGAGCQPSAGGVPPSPIAGPQVTPGLDKDIAPPADAAAPRASAALLTATARARIASPSSSNGPRPGRTPAPTSSSGRLAPDLIQHVIRENYAHFRLCYEAHLRGGPNLQARVNVRFVIGPDGKVSHAEDAHSDLPDSATIVCVVKAFYDLSFPEPEGGSVTVVYPLLFGPGPD